MRKILILGILLALILPGCAPRPQSSEADPMLSAGEVQNSDDLAGKSILSAGELPLLAERLKSEAPVEAYLRIDNGSTPGVSTRDSKEIEALYAAFSKIVIGEETRIWTADRYHVVRFIFEDGTEYGVNFNASSLDIDNRIYTLENDGEFWDACAVFMNSHSNQTK